MEQPFHDVIRKALPTLQESEFQKLFDHLDAIGVRSDNDLQFVAVEDVIEAIPLIAAKRLVHYLKNSGQDQTTSQPSNSIITSNSTNNSDGIANSPSNHVSTSNSPTSSTTPVHVPIQITGWVSSYQVPWEKMPSSLRQSLAQGQKPKKEDRLAMVRIIVDSIREVCLNPKLSQCSAIAQRICEKYPTSFAEMFEGEVIGNGYSTLESQIKTRADYVNRDNTLVRVRKPRRLSADMDDSQPETSSTQPTASKCAKTDSYGCINWQPLDLPEGETPASAEAKREEMVSLFSIEGPRAAERGRVDELMKMTYTTQRYAINRNPPPSVVELKEQWPFLFFSRFMCAHFSTLTGIDVDTRLQDSLNSKGKKLIHFFQSQLTRWTKEVKTVLKDISEVGNINHGVASLLVTMAYFKEKEDSLFLLADVTTTSADAEASLSLPSTPRLLALGDSVLEAQKWMLAMEGDVLIQPEDLPDFSSAAAVLMACYYVFNIEYQEEAASTLEFFQRFFLRINPEGSKCTSKTQVSRKSGKKVQRKSTGLNRRVATLIREIVEFDLQNY